MTISDNPIAQFEELLRTSPGRMSMSRGLRQCTWKFKTARSNRMHTFWAWLALKGLAGEFPHGYHTESYDIDFDKP